MKVKMLATWLFISSLLLLSTGGVSGVRITEMIVPSVAIEGDDVHLRCDYEDDGREQLYSLKWYKDGKEFFRHQPGIPSPSTEQRCTGHHIYAVEGVNVDCWVSTERDVVLKSVSKRSSGNYQCEVIGEHPKFTKLARDTHLTVYSEPLLPPLLVGNQENYVPFEHVALNCTSTNTEYVPELTWFINNRPALSSYVRQVNARTVGLGFQVQEEQFHKGVIEVKCVTSFGSHHKHAAEVQLMNRDYLSIQEYYNAGKKKTPCLECLALCGLSLGVLRLSVLAFPLL